MQGEYIEHWQAFGKDAFESVKELETIGAKTFERLTAQNLELVNAYVEAGVKQMSLLTETRDYKDLVSNQVELTSHLTAKVVDNAKRTADILNDLRAELTGWYETKLNNAAKAVVKKTPAKKAA